MNAPIAPAAQLPAATLRQLRERISRLDGSATLRGGVVRLGLPEVDSRLPGGGLAAAALHEVAGAGAQVEHGAAATLLVAGLLAPLPGKVLWVLQQPDLFAPALAGVGLHPDRLLLVQAGRPALVLLVMEEGLRHAGLAAVVGEVSGKLGLTASRRLQLAAEASGVLAVALRRTPRFDDPALAQPTAAVTRWAVAALPSPPPLAHAPATPGLGRGQWRLDLLRCRGGVPHSWIVEACDAQGRLSLVSDLADRQGAAPAWRAAG